MTPKFIHVTLVSDDDGDVRTTTASMNVDGIALVLDPVNSPRARDLPYEVGCEVQLFGMRGDTAIHLVQTREEVLELIHPAPVITVKSR
jgi:hypothetical protein